MLFVLTCIDKPNSVDLRLANRPDHIDYLKSKGDRIKLGGPFTGADHKTPTGSMLIIEAETAAQVEEIAANDPYTRAGLFESVTVRPWLWTIKPPQD